MKQEWVQVLLSCRSWVIMRPRVLENPVLKVGPD